MKKLVLRIFVLMLLSLKAQILYSMEVYTFDLNESNSTGTVGYSTTTGFRCSKNSDCEYQFNYSFSGTVSMSVDYDDAYYNTRNKYYFGAIKNISLDNVTAAWVSATPINGTVGSIEISPYGYDTYNPYFTKRDNWIGDYIYEDDSSFYYDYGDYITWGLVSGNLNESQMSFGGSECEHFENGSCVNRFSFELNTAAPIAPIPIPGAMYLFVSGISVFMFRKWNFHSRS